MRPTVSLKVMVEDYIRDHPGASQYEIAEHFGSTGVTYGNLLYSGGITRARLDHKAGRPYGKTEACYAYIHVLTPRDAVEHGSEYKTMHQRRCERGSAR